jgi:cytochrome c oxidase subunit 2
LISAIYNSSQPGGRRRTMRGGAGSSAGIERMDAMKTSRIGLPLGVLAFAVGAVGAALAQPAGEPRDLPVIGVPVPGGVNYQPAVTSVAHDMHWLSHMIHGIMTAIVLLVVVLLAIVIVRFNSRRNPDPASFTTTPGSRSPGR